MRFWKIPQQYLNEPTFYINKKEAKIFNYKSVITISNEEIETTYIKIKGKNLMIKKLDLTILYIKGRIEEVIINEIKWFFKRTAEGKKFSY